jgi:NAD(P)H dehydrogenase (quinone)
MTIAITGGSGKLGRMVVDAALRTGNPGDFVVTTRSPAALADYTARGADVRFADFDQPDSLTTAFDGVERLLVISASNATGKRHDEHQAAVSAAQSAGVSRLFFTSMPNVDDPTHPSGLVAEEYRDAEEMITASGLTYTVLRVAPYTELNAVERLIEFTEGGVLRMNAGAGRVAFISRRDVAGSVAAALVSDRYANEIIDLTGPALHTFTDLTEIVNEVLGIPLSYADVTDEQFLASRLEAGDGPLLAEALAGTAKAFRLGYFDVLTGHAEQLLGVAPRSLRTVIEANAELLSSALR